MKARNILDAIRCAGCWLFRFYQQPYNKEWNRYLNYLIDKCEVKDEGIHTISFDDNGVKITVWKHENNKFYSYGHQYLSFGDTGDIYEFRPSFFTMIKLSNLVDSREQERRDAFVSELASKLRKAK
ncbi:hypothetical protein GKR54_15020 [Providencia alcalifaciens]|uniref:hypothetical protein n=1 Tax=Providencia alcalifaciens TaxID=126385 RepID=UPI0012B5A512|nr:hypothetical protein [Providencia alcalifaciens]MTC32391.1 hypothetical protein [Providencia alcalifaciens]